MSSRRLFVFVRHAHSASNDSGQLNGDPKRPVALTPAGERQAHLLGEQLRNLPVDAAVVSRFPRAHRTAELALAGRNVRIDVERDLDEIDVGALEGRTIDAYRQWKRAHPLHDRFPNGESLLEALSRYVCGLRTVAAREGAVILIVSHLLPVRYVLDAADAGVQVDESHRDVPHAVPFLIDERALRLAVARLEALCREARQAA